MANYKMIGGERTMEAKFYIKYGILSSKEETFSFLIVLLFN